MNEDVTLNYILFTMNDRQKKLLYDSVAKVLENDKTKATRTEQRTYNSLNEQQKIAFQAIVGMATEERDKNGRS